MSNLKILFLITSSKTHNHYDDINIDRVDLTRKMDVVNTWGQDALNLGHDIMFFEGDSEIEYYDDNTKTLYLKEDDSYEIGVISSLFVKLQKACDWVIKNKEFDIVYNCDDDVFVNLPEFLKLDLSYDFISYGSLGGGGFVMSKKSIELISNYTNTEFKQADVAIYSIITNSNINLKINIHNIYSTPFYFPGELYATIHYVSGKRAYFLHNMLNYYHENGYTNRKIVLGGLLDSQKRNDVVSYESTIKRKSPRWYDFTIDPNNWEYHGGYTRSNISFNNLKDFWPYSKNSTKCFVINFNNILSHYVNTELFTPNLNYLIEKCEESLIDKDNLFLLSENNEIIDGWIIDNDIKKTFKLNFELLNNCNYYKKMLNKEKIVVCQFYTSNVSYGEYSEKINKRYCEENNYGYFVEKDIDKIKHYLEGRSWTWYKPHLIKEVFEIYPNCEYVLFLDIDAIFCNNNRKIEEFISNDFSILMTNDYGPSLVNAGVMLLKNNQFSKDFIKNWWDICEEFPQYKGGLWHDQTCIGLLHSRLQTTEEFKIIDNSDFNSIGYDDNKFIFHAFAFGNLPNRTIDSIYYKKFNITPTNTKNLSELGSYYSTDKEYLHNYYNRFYQKILSPKQSNCDILEIGSFKNNSLKVWKDFFNEGVVHGLDIIDFEIEDDRIKIFKVNQSNDEELINFSNLGFKYDVIIDDGSHKMKDQQITSQLLFKNLKEGGLLIIEDLQTSIECKIPEKSVFGWGDPQKTTCLEMIQSIIDKSPKTDYVTKEWEYFYNNIDSIEISKDRQDSIYSIIKKKQNIKIKVVYHCYLVGDWKNIVSEQLYRLKKSGLYDSADNIFVTLNLGNSSYDEFIQLVSEYPKLDISVSDGNNAEYPGIKKVREISLIDNSYVLYFHTKGVSNTYEDYHSRLDSIEKIENIKSWRECLEYFVIDKWEECVNLLNEYDNVGVTCNNNWYWGNFWWSQTRHIQNTEPVGVWSRWAYEDWLNKGSQNVKNYEWFKFNYNPYLTNISEDWYKKEKKYSDNKIVLHKAFYGTPKFQIDEGYSNTNLNQGEDVTEIVKKLLQKEDNLKFNFNVNNLTMGGDPIPGIKKFLMVEFSCSSNLENRYKIGISEEENFNYN